jgi:hypothetical protein
MVSAVIARYANSEWYGLLPTGIPSRFRKVTCKVQDARAYCASMDVLQRKPRNQLVLVIARWGSSQAAQRQSAAPLPLE